jgi:hypothetical protein
VRSRRWRAPLHELEDLGLPGGEVDWQTGARGAADCVRSARSTAASCSVRAVSHCSSRQCAALRAQLIGPTRPARAGAALSILGAGLLVVFGVLGLVPLLLTGSVFEASFLASLVGMLLLSVGTLTWGLSLRRRSPVPGVWQLLLLSGATACQGPPRSVASRSSRTLGTTSLVVMFASWTALGAVLLWQSDHLPAWENFPAMPGSRPTTRLH